MKTNALILMVCVLMASTGNSLQAAGGGAHLESSEVNARDVAAVQKGAKWYVNYCFSCHSAQYMRYNRLSEDLDLTEEQVMKNLVAVLEAASASASTVIKTTCFIKDMNDFVAFNAVYGKYFPESAPARSCVEVARLPKDVLVEVEAIASTALKDEA